ncbi:MAG TPA: CHAT domain-containing protein [Verrucomicrobiota bacterium]|nr:CHAT domain-containing protein [Verrucomicrobiota bacterium]
MFKSDRLKSEGKLAEAIAACGKLIEALIEQLKAAEQNNALYPDTPFALQPTVGQLVNALLTQSDVIEAEGDLEKAESVREKATRLSQKYLPPVDAAERQRQRASSLIAQGRFHEALLALTEARDLFEIRGDRLPMATVVVNLAGILEWLGDFERARAEARRALDLIGPLPEGGAPRMSHVLALVVGGNLKGAEAQARMMAAATELQQLEARMNRRLGRFEEAEKAFRALVPRLPRDIAEAGIGFQIAAIRIEQGRYQEGLQHLERIKPYFTGLARPKLGTLLSYEAEALLGMKKLKEALGAAAASCQELERYHDADSLWKSEWRRGRALAGLGRGGEALAAFVSSANVVDGLRKAPLGYRLDSTYLRDKLPMFVDGIQLGAARGEGKTCCHLVELVKSRSLTATLSVPATPEAQESEIDRKLDAISCHLDALEYDAIQKGDSLEAREAERARLGKERTELLWKRRISEPRWRSLTAAVPFDVQALQRTLLEREQAALTLFAHDNEVVSVLVTGTKCEARRMELTESVQTALRTYRANLQAEESDAPLFDPSALELRAEQLVSEALLEEAIGSKSLVIAPHGELHQLPWAGVHFRGKRLFEHLPVGILPNLSCIRTLQTHLAKQPHLAILGAPDYRGLPNVKPLPLASREIEIIAGLYADRSRLIERPYTDTAATEEHLWQLVRNEQSAGGILHVVCHGDFIPGDPMSSGLLLTGSRVDGTELVRARLRFDEVVLSACATGRRPTQIDGVALTGDDIVGLPGALLEAGARSVLVSVPAARDDAAMQFMTTYHDFRVEGETPLAALQKTQIEMLRNGFHEPALWVGFSVYGCQ